MSHLQNIAPWAVAIAALIGFLGVLVGGVIAWANRKPDRMELITDGAWKLKGEAERQLASALVRITDLEGQLRGITDKLLSVEASGIAQIEAQKVLHTAQLKAQQAIHEADMATKDGIILRLTEKVDALELKVNQLSAVPVVTVSTTETTTKTNAHPLT
jgi:hypothetical protein